MSNQHAAPEGATAGGTSSATPAVAPPERKGFNWTYWNCNIIEMWERLAYYTLRPVAPIYIAQASEPGGLHLPQETKGWIYMWWAIFQSFLPMITGGYADRYGYKRTLFFSITMNMIGYLVMAAFHSYYGFFAGIIILAIGTAFFKPSLQATLAHNLNKANSSLGWGIFYWVVNFGSVIGHYISPLLLGRVHSAEGWQSLFLACAGFTALNYLLLFTYKDVPSGASKSQNPLQVFGHTLKNIFEARLITWLLIMSCFWLMMYQLWDLQPNFIEDWVDSAGIASHVPFQSWVEWGDRGVVRVPQQVLISLNALLIVAFMVPVSWAVRRLRTLSAMFVGMLICTGGVLAAGLTGNGWILLLGIFFFSLGEMLTGPKKNEYLGLIAPPGKKGLYLGYVNIPVGVGVGLGSLIAGYVYGHWGEKATLALKELGQQPALVARAAQSSDWSDALDRIPPLLGMVRDDAFERARTAMGVDETEAAVELLVAFRHDRGQIANLALIELAQRAPYAERVRKGLPDALRELADELTQTVGALPPQAPASQPGVLNRSAAELRTLADQIASGTATPEVAVLARYVNRIADWIHIKPFEALTLLRDADAAKDGTALGLTDLADRLWERYGTSAGVLNNLALEYLAQETYLLRDAVEALATRGFTNPLKEIPERIGIGRTKSFDALSAALGASSDEVVAALANAQLPGLNPTEQLYVYLVQRDHVRYITAARRDWLRDVDLLREMIESDPAAHAVVAARINQQSLTARIMSPLRRLFGRSTGLEGVYERLALEPDLLYDALSAKDWTQTPQHAVQLMQLNPYEARARVAAEVAEARMAATHRLWNKYHPQYKVWIPFAAIGVVAATALGIFGQMAKRWKDMNA